MQSTWEICIKRAKQKISLKTKRNTSREWELGAERDREGYYFFIICFKVYDVLKLFMFILNIKPKIINLYSVTKYQCI